MNILVTGADGYLGSAFSNFLRHNYNVISWDVDKNLFNLNFEQLRDMQVNAIVNFAVIADFSDLQVDIQKTYFNVNVKGVEHLTNQASKLGIPLVQISTREVIGIRNFQISESENVPAFKGLKLVNEEEPCLPLHAYGKTKLIGEFIVLGYKYGSVIRLNTCYTDNIESRKGLIANLICKSKLDGVVTLDNGGLALRDPLHINDLAKLVICILSAKIYGQLFHAGGGEVNFINLKEICLGVNDAVKIIDGDNNSDRGFLMDISKAKNILGWRPEIEIRKFIKFL